MTARLTPADALELLRPGVDHCENLGGRLSVGKSNAALRRELEYVADDYKQLIICAGFEAERGGVHGA